MRLFEVVSIRHLRRGLVVLALCLAGCRVTGQPVSLASASRPTTIQRVDHRGPGFGTEGSVLRTRDRVPQRPTDIDRLFVPPDGTSIGVEPVVALIGIEPEAESADENDPSEPVARPSPFAGALECPCETINWRDDLRDLCPMLCDDACSVVTWKNAIILGVATGGVLALRENLDGEVRGTTAERPERWGDASQVLRQFGEASWQVPVLFGLYGVSVWKQDAELHSFSKAVISAHALASLSTVVIKGATNTGRPTEQYQNGNYGFPSYHTSSTFAIAATIDEYYGWRAGGPAYALAGLVGWSRIDQREHDLSDVVFGAVLGYAIGKSVAATHLNRDCGVQVFPYFEPVTRTAGLMLDVPF
jgi:hypothetical protein